MKWIHLSPVLALCATSVTAAGCAMEANDEGDLGALTEEATACTIPSFVTATPRPSAGRR